MKRSHEILLIATSLVLAGCSENRPLPNQATMEEKPRRCIPCVKTSPHKALLVTGEASGCTQRSKKITTANPTAALKALSAELKELSDTGELTADSALWLLEKHLGGASFADAFSGLSDLMTSSDVDGRIAALNILTILKGEWCAAEINADEAGSADSSGANIANDANRFSDESGDDTSEQKSKSLVSEKDDVEQRAVYTMMTLGLQDDNASVRDAAYEALFTLPHEERSALSLQLMGNDDVALKERLLMSCAGDDSEFARNVSFHGLDATESSVQALAENNVKQLTGQSFASSDDAFAWYEQQISTGE